MNGAHATRFEGLGRRTEDRWVAWGPGWTRVLTAMLTTQRAGKGQGVHEDCTGVPGHVAFPSSLTKYLTKQPKERFIRADI